MGNIYKILLEILFKSLPIVFGTILFFYSWSYQEELQWKNSSFISKSFPICILLFSFMVFINFKENTMSIFENKSLTKGILLHIFYYLVLYSFCLLICLAGDSIYNFYLIHNNKSVDVSKFDRILVILFLIFGATSLYYFKLKHRIKYGIAEISFGIFIGVQKITSNKDTTLSFELYIIVISASLFLIVRGLDNIYTELTLDKNKIRAYRLLIKIKNQIKKFDKL